MQIVVNLEDKLFMSVVESAASQGETLSEYIQHMLRTQAAAQRNAAPQVSPERLQLIRESMQQLQEERPSLGRNGMDWREFIHQGHGR